MAVWSHRDQTLTAQEPLGGVKFFLAAGVPLPDAALGDGFFAARKPPPRTPH
jgi:hypothetical protein